MPKRNDKVPLPRSTLVQLNQEIGSLIGIMQEAGISPVILAQPCPMLKTIDYFSFWRCIEKYNQDGLLGLRLDNGNHYGICDPAVMMMQHSATFLDALNLLSRYKKLVCPQAVKIQSDSHQTLISTHWTTTEQSEPMMITDMFFATIHSLLRHHYPNVTPLSIELTRQSVVEGYAEHFGCTIKTGCEYNRLIYRTEVLQKPLTAHNPYLLDLLIPEFENALLKQAGDVLKQQIKLKIYRNLNGSKPTLKTIADQLFLSERTLQRQLNKHHLSFQQLLNETRFEAAEQLLQKNEMNIGEIAFYLGYQDIHAFSRAFRRWYGVSPNQWRKQNNTLI
ncbi:helix-turn-helix domain-containing protein [Rodentibacter myodis]|uniref:HTH araC/xylS-type domain-containing protein n=1 Tax=Rodentibacter myodis TaxID=1907939 RepID=A0A1V3JKP4_9PAST|nr:AraC family transcriptional regulator [Rodentibacter myodis]OOF56957.1 hypothetical protein BKL49_10120 [Rodentibacter myodis]